MADNAMRHTTNCFTSPPIGCTKSPWVLQFAEAIKAYLNAILTLWARKLCSVSDFCPLSVSRVTNYAKALGHLHLHIQSDFQRRSLNYLFVKLNLTLHFYFTYWVVIYFYLLAHFSRTLALPSKASQKRPGIPWLLRKATTSSMDIDSFTLCAPVSAIVNGKCKQPRTEARVTVNSKTSLNFTQLHSTCSLCRLFCTRAQLVVLWTFSGYYKNMGLESGVWCPILLTWAAHRNDVMAEKDDYRCSKVMSAVYFWGSCSYHPS